MLTTSDTGEDMTPWTLREEGIVLTGRLAGADGQRLSYADDLATTLAAGDAFVATFKARIDEYIQANAVNAPAAEPVPPTDEVGEPPRELDLEAAGVTSIVWATGYRMDFAWIVDAEFDDQGYPLHQGGVTPEPGLYFVGLPWLSTRAVPAARRSSWAWAATPKESSHTWLTEHTPRASDLRPQTAA